MNPMEQGVGPAMPEAVCQVPAHTARGGLEDGLRAVLRALHTCGRLALLVACVLVVLGLSPLLLILGACGRRLPPPVRGATRLALLYGTYLLTCEVSAVLNDIGFHASRRRTPLGPSEHHALCLNLVRRSTGLFFGPGLRAIGVRVHWPEPPLLEPERPVVVLLRHAGLLNMQLGIHLATGVLRRRPYGVCKSAAACLPGAAALLRLTSVMPLRWNAEGRARAAREFAAMGPRLGRDAAVILPEGTNFSTRRRWARIAYLRRSGRHDLATAAEAMPHVLPPLARGAGALLATAPDAQVLVVGHTGLEDVLPWRLGPGYSSHDETALHISWRSFAPEEVPRDPDGFETWLYERWRELDAWVLATRTGRVGRVGRTDRVDWDDPPRR
ncbi:hypothetical protein ACFYNY_08315 [Streptomyces sp. NPDC006530]|uniref:hypothetical protein n=1 Tax=Streptomyces sp. NPDC006530 TaxID=3364750 RepID=UPI0036AA5C60